MNQSDQKDFTKRKMWWVQVYEYHKEAIGEARATLYAKDTQTHPLDDLNAAWVVWRRDRAILKPPMPANLLQIIENRLDDETQAQLFAQNLWHCVEFYSKRSEPFESGAIQWIEKNIGAIGIEIIHVLGGWKSVWSASNRYKSEISIGAWRKMFLALIKKSQIEGRPVAMPSIGESKKVLTLLESKIKTIGSRKD